VQSIIDNYTLSDAKNYLIRVLYEHAGELRNQALEGISVGEMTGWTSKKLDSEKYKVKKNSVDAPMLARIAAAAGITIDELVAQIDERNLSLLKVGQPALASADAYVGQKFQAAISSIAPGVDPARGAVQVKLQVNEPPTYLRQDMTISVEIEVARKAAALALPVDAVHDIDSAKPWVWQVDGQGHAQHTPVQLGVRSGTRVEALSGLAAGAHVVAVPAPGLAQGQRVHAAKP